ncbi:UDP-N-acetylmuramate dehydrogenase [bacterium]|jgi:UDP-N-acetylmuramate dehydrogenase|nr:UDP-N-acetylmuramate dehydrogenase [bacterium]
MNIQKNVPLSDKNWFRTGGCAKFYCQPKTAQNFKEAIEFANQNKLEIFVLGQGANILVSDQGFDGLVIHPQIKTISHKIEQNDCALVTASAGTKVDEVIGYCLENNIIGLEEFACIPGSIGGAVYINMHYFKSFIGNFLSSATVMEVTSGKTKSVDKEWFNFGYDKSTLHEKKYILVDATFELKIISEKECAYAKGKRDEIIRQRTCRYPTSHTCGCFFRNFSEDEVTLEINGKKMISVAYYFDKIGIKGNLTLGNATVSHQHANMIVNSGNATSADIIAVARTMQELVKREYDIVPQTECILVGFKTYPLL